LSRAVTRTTWLVACACLVALAIALLPATALALHGAAPGPVDLETARTTTGPTPPPEVLRYYARSEPRAVPDAHVIAGVPAYIWRHGCAPTSLGMVVGFYDGHGYDALIPGDASLPTNPAIDQSIASGGPGGSIVGHYEDYSQPMDLTGPIKPDRSELPAGDEHAGDSIADFMRTSWSAVGLNYGGSWLDDVGPAFVDYVDYRQASYAPSYTDHYVDTSSLSAVWSAYTAEIDAGRPVVMYVDSDHDGQVDHAVAAIGYSQSTNALQYAFWDTWTTTIHWAPYGAESPGFQWGVYGFTALRLGAAPSPGPTPTPTPTDPPPLTTVSGVDGKWHATPVYLTFSATDRGSGVARTETRVDSGAWTTLADSTLEIGTTGVHTVYYRSWGNGNIVEKPAHSCTVLVDTTPPVSTAFNATARRGRSATLRYAVADFTPKARVVIVVRTLKGAVRLTLTSGLKAANTRVSVSFVCRLAPGTYRYSVSATDMAGNRQAKPAAARLVVN
jgi:hypothetical protein